MENRNLPTPNTAPDLWKATNAATVYELTAGGFEEISRSVSNKLSDLLEKEAITTLISAVGTKPVQMYVEGELVKLALNVNINSDLNLKAYQIPLIAGNLIENYKWESIEDLTLCFRRGASGYYGQIFRLDAAVIGLWLSKYLDEKYDLFEQLKDKEKKAAEKQEKRELAANPDTISDHVKKQMKEFGKGSPAYEEAVKIAAELAAHLPPKAKPEIVNGVYVHKPEDNRKKVNTHNSYRYFEVRGVKVMALSPEHANTIVTKLIEQGILIE